MDLGDLQRHWDAFGRTDPLWAILTDPARRGNQWDLKEFFATGQEEVAALFDRASKVGVPRQRRRALDFGCGAGRLTQALAAHVGEAIGVDVAPSMIDLARRYNPSGSRCAFDVNDRPDLSRFADKSFDLVYAGRVLQHMEPRYAEAYISEFVRVLAPGGFLSFDVPSEHGLFAPDGTPSERPLSAYRAAIELVSVPATLEPGGRGRVILNVANAGTHTWRGVPLNVGNHWTRTDGTVVTRDDGRAAVELPWAPGERREVTLPIAAPAEPGTYQLQCDVVEEGVTWFAELCSPPASASIHVGIGARERAADSAPTPAAAMIEEPTMEMHAVPRHRVERLLLDGGARILGVRPVWHCGPTWLTFGYDATR